MSEPEPRRRRPRKRFGQHFLEPAWADKLVAAIAPEAADRFLEVGPGPGALTLRLAPRVEHLTAVEIDRDIAAALRPRLPPNVELIEADILQLDLGTLASAHPLRVVGNLPYNISTPILLQLVDAYRRGAALRDATVMVQREVAERLGASPGTGDFGLLSVTAQWHADVQRLLTLPPGAFRPPPKVHSAVVRLRFRAPVAAVQDERLFGRMVKAMFTQRRKTLANALSGFAATLHVDPVAALEGASIDPRRRAETLHLTELARLADCFAGRARAE